MRPNWKNERGFSFLELLTVMIIIAILAGMASLSASYIRRERLSSTARKVLGDLQLARGLSLTTAPPEAMPNMRGFGINFVSANSYSMFTFDDGVTTNFVYDGPGEAANPRTTTLPSPVQLTHRPVDRTIVIFDRFGIPRDGTSWAFGTMTIILTDPNVSDLVKCIAVAETRIREGTWNGADCDIQ